MHGGEVDVALSGGGKPGGGRGSWVAGKGGERIR